MIGRGDTAVRVLWRFCGWDAQGMGEGTFALGGGGWECGDTIAAGGGGHVE
jgi:hypothetical protein